MIFLAIFLSLLCVVVMTIIAIYNRLVAYKNRMQEAWSGIDVYLRKRHDLVPGLIAVVKAYAAHEKHTFETVSRCRAEAMRARSVDAQISTETGLGEAIGQLIAIAESYPELKASIHFLELQKQLSALEEDLALARRYYNGTVRENNIGMETFPSNLVADVFRFRRGRFFEIEKSEQAAPEVTFS